MFLVKEVRVLLVPEIAASEHCSRCSARFETSEGRVLYQIVGGVQTGIRTPALPRCTSGPPSQLVVRRNPAYRLRRVSFWQRNILPEPHAWAAPTRGGACGLRLLGPCV
jgi:hypothetical protein